MYIKLGKISFRIRVSFALFFAVVANTAEGFSFILTFISVFFHELTHLFFLFLFGCKNAHLDFYAGGIKLKTDGFSMLGYEKTVICTLSAPVMNILAGVLFFVFWKIFGDDIFYKIFTVNTVIGVGNILPMPFLDGGRALNALLSKYIDITKVVRICDFLSFMTLISMIVVFFIMWLKEKYYIFLLFFFFYCTLGCISDKRGEALT